MTTPLEGALTRTLDAAARAAPEPPADLVQDVNRLLSRRRRRRLAAVSAATAVAAVTVAAVTTIRAGSPQEDPGPAPATAPAATVPVTVVTDGCPVRALPVPPQQVLVSAGAVDPSGRYVAGYADSGQNMQAVLWVDGRLHILDTPAASYATGVNAAGVVVGYSESSMPGGWVYRDGTLSRLPRLPGPGAANPAAINSRGDIAGISGDRAVIWPGDQPGQVRQVGDGPGGISGISDDGLMVGGDDRNGEARLWNRDGTVHAQPPGFEARLVAGPWVLGEAGPIGPAGRRYALWNLTTGAMTLLSVDGTGATGFLATDLGESGAVLITLFTEQGSRPAVLRDGTLILLPLPEDPRDVEARAISGDGRTIVGTDRARALLWRC